MRGFVDIVTMVSSGLCAENSAHKCSVHTSSNFCSAAVKAGSWGIISSPLICGSLAPRFASRTDHPWRKVRASIVPVLLRLLASKERVLFLVSCGSRILAARERSRVVKKGYWVVAYRSISDESAVKAYGALAVPACQSLDGRFLTVSTSQVEAHEAGLQL